MIIKASSKDYEVIVNNNFDVTFNEITDNMMMNN